MAESEKNFRVLSPPAGSAFSPEHLQYLRRWKRDRILITVTRWAILLILVLGWEALARLEWINTFVTSQPSRVWGVIVQMYSSGELWYHLGVTVGETIAGFVLGTLGGVLIAILLWWSPFWSRTAEPFIVVINSIPKVALGPIFIVWLGTNIQAIVAMAITVSIIVTVLMVFTGFQEVDGNKIKLLRTFGATKAQVLTKVVLPATIPTIVGAVKVNVGLSLVGTIVGEFLVAKAGLGFLIVYGGQVFNMSLVMAGVILLMLVSTLLYYVVTRLEAAAQMSRAR
jgi:NitT/TauT family transport system permease protein